MLTLVTVFALLALTSAVQVKRAEKTANLCSVCVGVVGYIEGFVAQEKTEHEIASEFDDICPVFGSFQPECEGIISEFLPAAIQYLDAHASPSEVCRAIALCDAQSVAIALPEQETEEVDAPEGGFCSICEAIAGFAESYLEQNKTIHQIVLDLDKVCALTPFDAQCKAFVKKELPVIIKYLEKKETPAQICARLGLCTKNAFAPLTDADLFDGVVAEITQDIIEEPQGGFCSICQAIVGFAESYLENNHTEMEIKTKLDGLCDLTGGYAAECKALVNQYLPQIIKYIEKDYTPAHICSLIGVCTTSVAEAKKEVEAPQGGFCSICQAIVGFAESYLEQNHTEMEIKTKLDGLCDLTGGYAAECKALVNQYLPQIIKYIEKDYTPAHICTLIGVCTSVAKPEAHGQAGCALCQTVVGYVEMFLQQNATEKQIAKKIKGFCKLVKAFQTECENIVDNLLPTIIANLEKKEPPAKVCRKIKLCKSSTADAQIVDLFAGHLAKQQKIQILDLQAPPAPKSGGLCSICELFVVAVESYLKENKTEAEIKKKLDTFCTDFGLGSSCTNFVNSELPKLVAWIEKDEPANTACAQIGVCSKKRSVNDADNLRMLGNIGAALSKQKRQQPKKKSGAECAICEGVVAYGEHFLEKNATLAKVKQELDSLCRLTGTFKSTCVSFVDIYLPQAERYLINKVKPTEACEDLGVCSKN